MGFHLMENFHRPYFACSVGEYWHRWHISLSTWFKDYVYIPLGGNRVGRWRKYFNLLVTFTVSGIWHGANWTFFCWGMLHGVVICIEKALGIGRKQYKGLVKCFHWAVTFIIVCIAFILFRANNIADALECMRKIVMQHGNPFSDTNTFIALGFVFPIIALKEMSEEFDWNIHIADSRSWIVRHTYIAIMISMIVLFGILNGDQFIYFQF